MGQPKVSPRLSCGQGFLNPSGLLLFKLTIFRLNPQFLGKLECAYGESPWFGISQACQRKMDLSTNKISDPCLKRLTFSFMFYMTHFKLQCSTDIEKSLPLPTLPQTSHNGKSKNFLLSMPFFKKKKKTKSQSLMGLFSCQNSHWPTVAVFTKGHDEKGRPILRPLQALCYAKCACVSALGYQENGYF